MDQPEGLSNRLQPRQFGDLRGWIEALDIAGEIQRIGAKVDWDCELGTIARKTFGTGHGPALLFENIDGYGPDDDVWSRAVFTGGLSNYSRVAMTLGLPQDAPVRDLVLATRHYLQQRVPPTEVKTGKVKENVVTGDDIDIYKVPVPKWHREDGGRYINTYSGDRDHGPRHRRPQPRHLSRHDRPARYAAGAAVARPALGGIHFQKWADRGMKMPVAHVYGWEPAMTFCASAPVPTGVSRIRRHGRHPGRAGAAGEMRDLATSWCRPMPRW